MERFGPPDLVSVEDPPAAPGNVSIVSRAHVSEFARSRRTGGIRATEFEA